MPRPTHHRIEWLLGAFFLVAAGKVAVLDGYWAAAFFFLLMGAFIFPLTYRVLAAVQPMFFRQGLRWFSVGLLFLIACGCLEAFHKV